MPVLEQGNPWVRAVWFVSCFSQVKPGQFLGLLVSAGCGFLRLLH